jgi:ATP-dependent DNA ligase
MASTGLTVVYRHACRLGCEGIVSKRLGSPYVSGRSRH